MNTRDVAISACSVLLGALLGIGSILYAAEEVALSGVDPNAVHSGQYRTSAPDGTDVSQFTKRSISRKRAAGSAVNETKDRIPKRRSK